MKKTVLGLYNSILIVSTMISILALGVSPAFGQSED